MPLTEVLPNGIRVGFDMPLNAAFSGLWQLAVVGTLPDSSLDWSTAKIFGIRGVDLDQRIVLTDPPPGNLKAPIGWTRAYLGQAVSTYECFVDLDALVPEPPSNQPKAWFEVAVSAADDKVHTPDWCGDPKWGNRPGNESEVTGPRRGERLRWAVPEKVEAIWPEGPLYATPADVDGRSFFTVRWKATEQSVRVLRAAAIDVFRADWDAGGKGLVGTPLVELLKKFPGLKAPALAVVDGRKSFAPIAAAYGELGGKAQQTVASSVDAAGAFLPVTAEAIAKAAAPDLVGPDSPLDYKPKTDVCAFVDSLDGLVAGRWFYRVGAVVKGGGTLEIGPASQPVVVLHSASPEVPRILFFGIADEATVKKVIDGPPAESLKAIEGLGQQPKYTIRWVATDPTSCWRICKRLGDIKEFLTIKPLVVDGVACWVDEAGAAGGTTYSVVAVSPSGFASGLSQAVVVPLSGGNEKSPVSVGN